MVGGMRDGVKAEGVRQIVGMTTGCGEGEMRDDNQRDDNSTYVAAADCIIVKLRPTRLRTELPRGGNTPKMGRLSKEDRLSQADPEQR